VLAREETQCRACWEGNMLSAAYPAYCFFAVPLQGSFGLLQQLEEGAIGVSNAARGKLESAQAQNYPRRCRQ
jgi:hypothetical protein